MAEKSSKARAARKATKRSTGRTTKTNASRNTRKTAKSNPSNNPVVGITDEQIADRARAIWRDRGCCEGEDERNWFAAEAQLLRERLEAS